MADNKQLPQVREATWEVVDSLRKANQAVAESLVSLQDHNLKFAQNAFLSWMELITQQTESVQHLQQQWGQQFQKQQGAFQKLMPTSMRIYMDFLRAPFSFSRQLVDAAKTVTQREQELVT